MKEHKALLPSLRDAIAARLTVEPPDLTPLLRIRPKAFLYVLAGGFMLHLLSPQIATLGSTVDALRSAKGGYLVMAVIGSVGTYLAAGLSLRYASPVALPYARTLMVSLASSFTSRLAPAGLGRVGLEVTVMTKAGAQRSAALASETLLAGAGGAVHATLMLILGIVFGRTLSAGVSLPSNGVWLVAVCVVLTTAAIVLGVAKLRTTLATAVRDGLASLRETAREPRRLGTLVVASACLNVAYVLAFDAALRSVGVDLSSGIVALAYLAGQPLARSARRPAVSGPSRRHWSSRSPRSESPPHLRSRVS